MEFNIGDRVIMIRDYYDDHHPFADAKTSDGTFSGDTGTVCEILSERTIGVRWDRRIKGGHSCGGHCANGYGWRVGEHMVELIDGPCRDYDPPTRDELSRLLGASDRRFDMGYYAHGTGNIEFRNPLNDEKRRMVEEILSSEYFEIDFYGSPERNASTIGVDTFFDDKYHGDAIEAALNKILGVEDVAFGCMEFQGEDGEHWRFLFDPEHDCMNSGAEKWREQTGHIVYED